MALRYVCLVDPALRGTDGALSQVDSRAEWLLNATTDTSVGRSVDNATDPLGVITEEHSHRRVSLHLNSLVVFALHATPPP